MGFDGFDAVEVIMDVEDAVGISIPDADAEKLLTAGELYEYVARRIPLRPSSAEDRCWSAVAFYRTRAKLAELYGIDGKTIRPDTRIEQFLPAEKERWNAWRHLGMSLRARLPRLKPPRWLRAAAVGVGVVVLSVTIALAPWGPCWTKWFTCGYLASTSMPKVLLITSE